MVHSAASWRGLLLYAVCFPLAIFLGYQLAGSLWRGLPLAGLFVMALSMPLLLRWHHVLLLVSWNAYVNVPFLPGQPSLWLVVAVMSLAISISTRTLDRQVQFTWVPVLALPLLVLLGIILGTAFLTGGIGFRVLGDAMFGGRRYIMAVGAILGFFALTAWPIPRRHVWPLVLLFFLGSATTLASNIIYAAGPGFHFLFNIFPPDWALHQVSADYSAAGDSFTRISGIAPAALAVVCCFLLYFGWRRILDFRRPWRLALLMGVIFASLLGGFRSNLALMILILGSQFFFEGLHRTRYLLIPLLGALLLAVAVIPVAHRLPLAAQRALTIFPLPLSPVVRNDATLSTEWRLEMWRVLLPEIPKHLLLGKGYGIAQTDLYLTEEAVRRGIYPSYEQAIVAGNYHSGPISVILPFGLPGFLAFLWFLGATGWVLLRNYRHGDPELTQINRFLLAYFVARTLFFFTIFGSLYSDLLLFTGLAGLSVSLNRGVARPPAFTPHAA